jgi:hypothetical protein
MTICNEPRSEKSGAFCLSGISTDRTYGTNGNIHDAVYPWYVPTEHEYIADAVYPYYVPTEQHSISVLSRRDKLLVTEQY